MKITVPDSLADISVKQYKALADIKLDENSTDWLLESISILCNLTKKQVGTLTIPETERISLIIGKLNNEDENNQELQQKIETFCGGGFFKNLNEILCILYRPIKTEGGDFYTIEKYEGDTFPNYWDDLKMSVVLGAVNFFLSIGVTLTKDLVSYLPEGEKAI